MKKTYPSVLIKGTHDQILQFKNIEFIECTSTYFINFILLILYFLIIQNVNFLNLLYFL